MNRIRTASSGVLRACGVAAFVLACALPAAAQSVTASDIQRLQDQIYQAGSDVSRLRGSNPEMAARLQGELDDLREDVIYLKVKMRREGSVSRNDYTDIRDRLQEVRSRAGIDTRGDTGTTPRWRTNSDRDSAAGGAITGGVNPDDPGRTGSRTRNDGTRDDRQDRGVGSRDDRQDRGVGSRDDRVRQDQQVGSRSSGDSVIPSGQEIDVRLETELSSATAQVEQRFEATTVADLYRGNDVLIPAGSTVRGVISGVTKTSRMERKGSLTVAFDQITIRGRAYPMRGTVTEAIESEGIKGEASRIGAGAGVGAIIGGIIGGVKGALLGVLIGGGGTVAATEGKDVTLPAGTLLRVRLDTPPAIR